MRLSHGITPPVFTRRVVGGFVVQYRRDPPYSVCGCSNVSVCRSSFSALQECGRVESNTSHPIYVVPSLIQTRVCPALGSCDVHSGTSENRSRDSGDVCSSDDVMVGGCDSVELRDSVELGRGYEVDGHSTDILMSHCVCGCGDNVTGGGCECGEGEGERMVSAHYYQESEETLSVTVWYNNRVSETPTLWFNLLHIV